MPTMQDSPATLYKIVELTGHFIDSLTFSKVLDTVAAAGGDFELMELDIGRGRKDFSYARIKISAPDNATLESIIEAIEPHVAKTPIHQSQRVKALKVWDDSLSIRYPEGPLGDTFIPKILMCAPDYFTVEYAINPWMKEGGACDVSLAKQQWEALYNTLRNQTKAQVLLMPPVDGLPDLVFTANAAFVYGDQAIVAHYKHSERQGEEPHVFRWFQEKGFQVTTMPSGIAFEGAGDALIWRDRVFAGYKTRTDIASHSIITTKTGLPVLSLELVNPRFYHIDVCICPLPGHYFLWYPGAFDEYGQSVIKANVPEDKRIEVTDDEAARFACNAVGVNDTVIFNKQKDERLANLLASRGFKPIQLDMSEFIKSGGSCKCLTLRVG